jgi:hypothetical protein
VDTRLQEFHESRKVSVYFPSEASESSDVLLVYDPFAPGASFIPNEKKKHLDVVEKELLKMAKDAADVKTELFSVDKRWHDTVTGALDTYVFISFFRKFSSNLTHGRIASSMVTIL